MSLSAFDIIGPAMIGPSSSHTAGAVRIRLVARHLLGEQPARAAIGLHGSFAATGQGHATDRALAAGLLGFGPADSRVKESLALAEERGISVTFAATDLGEDAHPNSALIELEGSSGGRLKLVASSIGGGMIRVLAVDEFATSFDGALETLVLWHADRPGYLAKITALLAIVEANIATIRTSRAGRGGGALTVIEVDAPLPPDCLSLVRRIAATSKFRHFSRLP
ncbi:MAG: L-serine ammonia-lyase, iron-sulfur-dependent subunit beta [Terrimicrobiaceae bacterium]|nr:L-serine ammonia-lyase, iron-sulfur-dependent subunit beta [Terrimicrobiaceae bacterium]